jgi:hypothetical protein
MRLCSKKVRALLLIVGDSPNADFTNSLPPPLILVYVGVTVLRTRLG